jgi:hypothetical protein
MSKLIMITSELPTEVQGHLDAAEGWSGLGDFTSASEELGRIRPELMLRPEVLLTRWLVHSKAVQWTACLEIGELLVSLAPEIADGWIRRSFSLRRLGRLQEAYHFLLPAVNKFPGIWEIPYDMARYCCQLGRVEEGRKWLARAREVGAKSTWQQMACEPDLKPLFTA